MLISFNVFLCVYTSLCRWVYNCCSGKITQIHPTPRPDTHRSIAIHRHMTLWLARHTHTHSDTPATVNEEWAHNICTIFTVKHIVSPKNQPFLSIYTTLCVASPRQKKRNQKLTMSQNSIRHNGNNTNKNRKSFEFAPHFIQHAVCALAEHFFHSIFCVIAFQCEAHK